MRALLTVFILLYTLTYTLKAQVILLKDGSMVKGRIVEITTNQDVFIEIDGGSKFFYKKEDIKKILLSEKAFHNLSAERKGLISLKCYTGVSWFNISSSRRLNNFEFNSHFDVTLGYHLSSFLYLGAGIGLYYPTHEERRQHILDMNYYGSVALDILPKTREMLDFSLDIGLRKNLIANDRKLGSLVTVPVTVESSYAPRDEFLLVKVSRKAANGLFIRPQLTYTLPSKRKTHSISCPIYWYKKESYYASNPDDFGLFYEEFIGYYHYGFYPFSDLEANGIYLDKKIKENEWVFLPTVSIGCSFYDKFKNKKKVETTY